MHTYTELYINGRWVPSTGAGSIEVLNASTEEVMGLIPEGIPKDIDTAVEAAVAAFDKWSATSLDKRSEFLRDLADGMTRRADEIATTIAGEVGMPIKLSRVVQVADAAEVVASYAEIVKSFPFEEQVGNSLIVREPVGVVGCITPWNYPLFQIVSKVAPALGAGCTVVLKPSEVAPLNAFIFTELVDETGLPPGVFNLVSGTGSIVGEALAAHPDVAAVSFTGSTRVGRRVSELASATIKRVSLELGGKSANVILDDADFEQAVTYGVGKCFLNSGQNCGALSRMLVPRARHDETVKIAKRAAEGYMVGDPFQDETSLGPLISDVQRERVRNYVRKGIDEGATLVTGGADAPTELPRGYYVKPTVFANVRSDMTIAQEEIFGPVLAIIPYEDEEDAVRIANDSIYGLCGAIWSNDPERAMRMAQRIRTGQVDINGGSPNRMAPFGGFKQSGRGRELGHYGLEEFVELKAIQR